MTKIEMARVVVQALFNLPNLPPTNNFNVKREARAHKEMILIPRYKLAVGIVERNTERRIQRALQRALRDVIAH